MLMEGSWFQAIIVHGNRHVMLILVLIYFHSRMMEELRGMEYEEHLRQTRLVTLEARRTRADIIEVFKIMKGLEGLKTGFF